MDFVPASIIYRDLGIPRSMLHDLAERGVIECRVKLLPDGRTIKLYDGDALNAWMNGGQDDAR